MRQEDQISSSAGWIWSLEHRSCSPGSDQLLAQCERLLTSQPFCFIHSISIQPVNLVRCFVRENMQTQDPSDPARCHDWRTVLPSPAEPKMWRIRKQGMKMARCPKIVTDSNLKVAGENSSTGGGMSRRKTLGELCLKGLGMLLHTGTAKLGLCCLSVVSRAKAGVTPVKNKSTSFCDCHPQNTAPSSPDHYPCASDLCLP